MSDRVCAPHASNRALPRQSGRTQPESQQREHDPALERRRPMRTGRRQRPPGCELLDFECIRNRRDVLDRVGDDPTRPRRRVPVSSPVIPDQTNALLSSVFDVRSEELTGCGRAVVDDDRITIAIAIFVNAKISSIRGPPRRPWRLSLRFLPRVSGDVGASSASVRVSPAQ